MYNYSHSPKKALAVDFVGGRGYRLTVPTKAIYDNILTVEQYLNNPDFGDEMIKITAEILNFNTENEHFTPEKVKKMFIFDGKKIDFDAMSSIFCAYKEFVSEVAAEYALPYYPYGEDEKMYYTVNTQCEKLVADYTGLNFKEIEELPLDTYLYLLRDAYIYKLSSSKEGLEYLENAYILTQTEPDRKALRAKFGRKE